MKSQKALVVCGLVVTLIVATLALPIFVPKVSAQGQIKHTVRAGENLPQIAQRYGTTVQVIVRANGLANPNVIWVGQVLTIPATGGSQVVIAPPAVGRQGVCAPTRIWVVHIVQYGENLSMIARRYGVSVQAIVDANGIRNPGQISVGWRLNIPGADPFQVNWSTGEYTQPTPTTPRSNPQPSGCFLYTVRAGDTLWGIATRNNTTVARIQANNRLGFSTFIYRGQSLKVCPGTQ